MGQKQTPEFGSFFQLVDSVETHALELAEIGDQALKQLEALQDLAQKSDTLPPFITAYFQQVCKTLELIATEIRESEQALIRQTTQQSESIQQEKDTQYLPGCQFFSKTDICIMVNRIERSKPSAKEWNNLRLKLPAVNTLIKQNFSTSEEETVHFEQAVIKGRKNRRALSETEKLFLDFYELYCRDLYEVN